MKLFYTSCLTVCKPIVHSFKVSLKDFTIHCIQLHKTQTMTSDRKLLFPIIYSLYKFFLKAILVLINIFFHLFTPYLKIKLILKSFYFN